MSSPKPEETMEVDTFELPQRDSGVPYRGAQESTVLANLYYISGADGKIFYKYRLDVVKVVASKDKTYDLSKGPRNDVATQLRRRVLYSLWGDLIRYAEKTASNPIVAAKNTAVYDCGNIIYASQPLRCFEAGGDGPIEFRLDMNSITSDNSKKFLGEQCTEVVFTLTPTIQFPFCLTGKLENHRESQQLLEILTSARIIKEGDYFMFMNKCYGKTSREDVKIGEGKSIKPGFEKNCRIGERDGKPVPLLQIDAKKSPFFDGNSVVGFCTEFLNLRDPRDLEDLATDKIRKLNAQLKNLVVRTTHTDKMKTRYFAINSLATKRVKDIEFEVKGQQMTLADYFLSQYKLNLKYPRSPVIVERHPKGHNYYPMEVLEIERGQRVSCQKASPQMGEKQIQECRLAPQDMKDYVAQSFKRCGLDRDNAFLEAFGIKIEGKWEHANATVLFPPKITYKNSSTDCDRNGNLNWRLGREQFIRGGRISTFYFIIFDDCVQDRDAENFLGALLGNARKFGIEVNERDYSIKRMYAEAEERIEELFMKVKNERDAYIMAVTNQKLDSVHDVLKAVEGRTGVISQHVSKQTFMKAIGPKGAFMVIQNLILKMNLKSKGINHKLEISWGFTEANRNERDVDKRVMPKYRMFIGLDVSHAGPQSFADRQLGVPQSEPSVVGMSYSITSPTEMKGTCWYQEARLAAISNLGAHMDEALKEYKAAMGRLPEDIYVFRGGVSEGEFDKIAAEIKDMKTGFPASYKPTIQCTVISTNSNFRIVPERIDTRARPMEQNVPAGTCVDSGITNPQYNEFILVGQKGIMGTVRPTRCVVVYAERGETGHLVNLEDLKILTNMLCYGHQVVTGSTALPCPLTAATNLSKRGRNNWKHMNFSGSDARTEVSGCSGGALKHDGSDDGSFFVKLSKDLTPKAKHHFWA